VRRVVAGAAAVALAPATAVLARALKGPDPNVRAVSDGCERSDTLLQTGRAPNWVRVYDSDTPATGAPPPFRAAEGIVNSNGIPWYSPHVSGGDTPYSHSGYDLNMDLRLTDPRDADLIGSGNDATAGADSGEAGRLHTEREAQATPFFVWPEPGDRLWIKGYWVWDCDHFTRSGAQAITGERTEIHPLMAIWTTRPSSPNSRAGETEADLFLTTDKTEAGQHADCAHKTKHDQDAFKQCVATESNFVDMSGTYKFVVRPPVLRGGGIGRSYLRIVDMGSVNAPRILMSRQGGAGIGIAFVVPRDGKRHVVAKRFFAGWTLRKPVRRHFRVTVERVLIRRAMDPACLPQKAPPCGTPETTHQDQVSQGPTGEWIFYWDVAGVWSLWKPTVFRVRDGQTIRPRVSTDVWVPPGKPFRVLVWPRECDWGRLRLGGGDALVPCPTQPEVGTRTGDDVPGGMLATFNRPGVKTLAPQWGIGTCPRAANPRGCYAVTVRVRRVG
jgi:hypothetical protein